ncbi:site-specific integrase [Paenarthrobacter ureafaciens]|uniref:site-specific integrase n=1 Tax=Paenarthrobacter ureafaciens TaxID=37931 RepID=UPI00140B617A|nr:site-specific integrase [Paenarthrobacter ureafaciens]MCY0972267.1 site-specific integrase [Paenarthrobacter ureafaciens]MCY0974984.1 site-specific integrase [Paenarthrobacter ureafaciens]
MTKYFPGPMTGPLAPYVAGYRELLAGRGYAKSTAQQLGSLSGRLSRWMDVRGLDIGALTDEVLQRFVDELAAEANWLRPTPASFVWLMQYLRRLGVIPVPEPPPDRTSPEQIILGRFERYLVNERGLAAKTVRHYLRTAASLMDWLAARSRSLDTMGGAEVILFTTGLYGAQSVGSVKYTITGLRSFLGWAFMEGLSDRALAGAVPSAASHYSNIPKGLSVPEVDALLASCGRDTATGRRDYAILVLVVRLGLRANEVASLTLTDVNWRTGDIVLRGKGRREEKLPLPQDVGSALAEYLRQGRPEGAGDALFLRVHAPVGGLASSGVSEVILAAGRRAGLEGIHAHRLRHTAATQLLRAGASLAEVGQVLRHRSPATTAQYAKVDHRSLRALALPWPGSQP